MMDALLRPESFPQAVAIMLLLYVMYDIRSLRRTIDTLIERVARLEGKICGL